MPHSVYVAGVGITAFERPRKRLEYHQLALQAATKALIDAGLTYDHVQKAYVGYCYGDSTCGQRALYQLGMTQIPIINLTNNCATGSGAIYEAHQAVQSGQVECALALGFERMNPGSLDSIFKDRPSPLEKQIQLFKQLDKSTSKGPLVAQMFAGGAKEYCDKYGATRAHVAEIAAKNHRHSVSNPYSQFKIDMSVKDVLDDMPITDFLTRSMCCPTSDGGGAAILCNQDFVKKHHLENQAIEIASISMATDSPLAFSEKSLIELTGLDMTRFAAKNVYTQAGITPDDIKIIELHDCFAANELLVYEGLGLTSKGKAHKLVENKDNTYGGKFVINPSGGLLSKGHPLGATGLGMLFYLCTQLRGWAGPMQVPAVDPKNASPSKKTPHALLHNLGLGGACVVAALKRPSFYQSSSSSPDGRSRAGYNPGAECKEMTQRDIDRVKSKTHFSEFAAKL